MQTLEYDDNLGWGWKNPFKAVYKGIKRGTKTVGRGFKSVALIVPQALASSPGSSLMNGDGSVGEEELALGMEGNCEREALERRLGDSSMGYLPNWVPRVQTAARGGNSKKAKNARAMLKKAGYTW